MTHEDYKAMLPLHSLSALDAQEAQALERHLPTCPDCLAELDEWQATAGALAYTAEPVEPSTQVRERIIASVRAEAVTVQANNVVPISRVAPRSTHRPPAFTSLRAIAAAVVLLGLIVGLVLLWRQGREARGEIARLSAQVADTQRELDREQKAFELITRPGTRMAELAGTKDAPGASAMLAVDSKSGRAILMAHGLPQAPAGMGYQLWFINGSKPMPGKVFRTDASGNAMMDDQLPAEALNAATFAVTLEPQGGVTAPTGKMFLLTPARLPS